MECKQIEKMLDRFIKQDLDERRHREVDHHIALCSACREQLHIQKLLHQLLDMPEEVKAPDNFAHSIMEKIERLPLPIRKPKPFYTGWGKSLVAAGVLMMVLNLTGVSKGINYDALLNRTNVVQRSIVFSMDETSKSIVHVLNNFQMKIWRD